MRRLPRRHANPKMMMTISFTPLLPVVATNIFRAFLFGKEAAYRFEQDNAFLKSTLALLFHINPVRPDKKSKEGRCYPQNKHGIALNIAVSVDPPPALEKPGKG